MRMSPLQYIYDFYSMNSYIIPFKWSRINKVLRNARRQTLSRYLFALTACNQSTHPSIGASKSEEERRKEGDKNLSKRLFWKEEKTFSSLSFSSSFVLVTSQKFRVIFFSFSAKYFHSLPNNSSFDTTSQCNASLLHLKFFLCFSFGFYYYIPAFSPLDRQLTDWLTVLFFAISHSDLRKTFSSKLNPLFPFQSVYLSDSVLFPREFLTNFSPSLAVCNLWIVLSSLPWKPFFSSDCSESKFLRIKQLFIESKLLLHLILTTAVCTHIAIHRHGTWDWCTL